MFEFKYVSKFDDNLIQFLQEKRLAFLIVCEVLLVYELEFFEIHFET